MPFPHASRAQAAINSGVNALLEGGVPGRYQAACRTFSVGQRKGVRACL